MKKEDNEVVKDKEFALFIKECRKNGSWRIVAEMVANKYPELDILSGNQIDGMWLCREAAIFLDETDWR